MRHRLKLILVIIVCVTTVWLASIVQYLPKSIIYDNIHLVSLKSKPDTTYSQRRSILPPNSPGFMKYFQSPPKLLTVLETLYYEFDPSFNNRDKLLPDSKVLAYTSVNQSQHEKATLELNHLEWPTDNYVKRTGYTLLAYNILVSNRIGLIRSLPDTRPQKCPMRRVEPHDSSWIKLTASIVICYYNEAPSALLRTIYSILLRTDLHLIKEIILVDDHSDTDFKIDHLKPFINSNLVKLTRTPKREGLIRARLFGANLTNGDVMIFLDSHVEANVGWLEPLLETIQSNSSTIASPMIDLINAETLVYSASPMVMGGTTWGLNFKWESVPKELLKTYDDFAKPIYSPTIAGGLYAIDRKFFYQIGSYDAGMELWGGENIELSLRTWMCGGSIVILPCSRMGHIFRKRRPYGPKVDEPDSFTYNSLRSARVWLDEYTEKFYHATPHARDMDSGDISERLALRHRLGCHNFSWFIENVYPSMDGNKDANDDKLEVKAKEHSKRYKKNIPTKRNLFEVGQKQPYKSVNN